MQPIRIGKKNKWQTSILKQTRGIKWKANRAKCVRELRGLFKQVLSNEKIMKPPFIVQSSLIVLHLI